MAETKATSSPAASSSLAVEAEDLEKLFKRFDCNGDGKISESEMGGVLRSLGSGASEDEVRRMMREMDSDRDGFVDLKEFKDFVGAGGEGEGNGQQQLVDAFGMYDLDGNGKISAKELHLVMRRMGMKCSLGDCSRMIRSVDADGDGSVDFQEFKLMMTRRSSSSSSSKKH